MPVIASTPQLVYHIILLGLPRLVVCSHVISWLAQTRGLNFLNVMTRPKKHCFQLIYEEFVNKYAVLWSCMRLSQFQDQKGLDFGLDNSSSKLRPRASANHTLP